MNLFAYCGNSPIIYVDPTGKSILLASILIGALIGGLFGAIEGGISAKMSGRDVGFGVLLGALGGLLLGGISGALGFSGKLAGAKLFYSLLTIGATSMLIGGATEYCNQIYNREYINLGNIYLAGIKSALSNVCSFAFANYIGQFAHDAFDVFGNTLGTSIIYFGINLLLNLIEIPNKYGIDKEHIIC